METRPESPAQLFPTLERYRTPVPPYGQTSPTPTSVARTSSTGTNASDHSHSGPPLTGALSGPAAWQEAPRPTMGMGGALDHDGPHKGRGLPCPRTETAVTTTTSNKLWCLSLGHSSILQFPPLRRGILRFMSAKRLFFSCELFRCLVAGGVPRPPRRHTRI